MAILQFKHTRFQISEFKDRHGDFTMVCVVKLFLYSTAFFQFVHSINFFGTSHSDAEWSTIQNRVNLMSEKGSWKSAWKFPNFKPMFSRPCTDRNHIFQYCAGSNSNKGLEWTWTSDEVRQELWSPETFCQMAGGRNMMIVGDSLNNQLFHTLHSSLWAQVLVPREAPQDENEINRTREQLRSQCTSFCPDHFRHCDGPVQVILFQINRSFYFKYFNFFLSCSVPIYNKD
jgi:hypothetical protein